MRPYISDVTLERLKKYIASKTYTDFFDGKQPQHLIVKGAPQYRAGRTVDDALDELLKEVGF